MKKILFTSIAILLGLTACSSDDENNNGNEYKPITLTTDEVVMAKANESFAMQLFNAVNETEEDADFVAISPLSASLALSMVANGAKDETQQEILEGMSMEGWTIDELNAYNKKLVKELPNLDALCDFTQNNMVWRNNDFSLLKTFTDAVGNSYKAEFCAGDNATSDVNKWCAKKLGEGFPSLLDKADADARIVLVNTLYFKGVWATPFSKDDTKDGVFYNADGTESETEYMCMTEYIWYAGNDMYQSVTLPFGNGAFNFVVVLPNEGHTTAQCINALKDASDYKSTIKTGVNLKLPKFSIKTKKDLLPTLQQMGMGEAFTSSANYGNLSNENVSILKVKQANMFSIDEEGAKLLSGTVAEGMVTYLPPADADKAVDFNVNSPFIFLLTEKSTGTILFIGKMANIK